MTWGLKKYCSLWSCCSADDALRPLVHRVNRSISANKRPPKQKQGLLELLSSYQLAKNQPESSMREWALRWARSGTLLYLLRIAVKLETRVETTSMELVCLNAALIVAYLPEGSPHIREFLADTWQLVSHSRKRNCLGVFRLLLVLLRIERFREEAATSDFARLLYGYYNRILSIAPSKELALTIESSEEEETSVIVASSSDEDIIDDLLNAEPPVDPEPLNVVPRLNFTWLKNVPGRDTHPRHDRALSIDRSGRTEVVTTISDRSTPGTSDRCERHEVCLDSSTPLDGRSLQRIKNLFRPKRCCEGDDANGMGHVLEVLGLTETITLLGNLNDTYFTQKYDVWPHLEQEWRLTPVFKEKESEGLEREKLALLEVFLFIAPSLHPATASIKNSLSSSVVHDLLNHLQNDSLRENVLRHCIAVYVEYSMPLLVEELHGEMPYRKLVLKGCFSDSEDALLEMLSKELHKLTTLRRPGDGVFHKLGQLLMVASEYFEKCPSPMKIMNKLVFPLVSVQRMFITRAGHILRWGTPHVQAFRSLLKFHKKIFEKCRSVTDCVLFEKLVIQVLEEEWMRLLKDFSQVLLSKDPYQWLEQNERYGIIVETWRYFTTLMLSLAQHNTHQTMHCGYLDDFDFLLVPEFGLVSVVLDSSDADITILEQALKLVIASCSLTRSSFIADNVMAESFLKQITSRFLDFCHNPPLDWVDFMPVMALHLQAVGVLMESAMASGRTQILNSGLVERLVSEITLTTGLTARSPHDRVPVPSLYSSRPSTSRDTHRKTFPRTEPVEIFAMTGSDSDLEAMESLVPSFNVDLPFSGENEPPRTPLSPSSSCSESLDFNPPQSHPLEDSSQLFFFQDRTVEDVENELFGAASDVSSVESETDSDNEDWPSDLSVHGDIEEDGRRWEQYLAQKKFEEGRISYEEMQTRLAALSTASTTDGEAESVVAAVPSFPVPLLNFDRLKSVQSETNSALISGQTHNPPFDASPSVSNPPNRSVERGKQQIESAVSPLELSPVHQRHGSNVSRGLAPEATGLLIRNDGLHVAAVELLIEILLFLDRYDDHSSVHVSDLVASISSALFHDLNSPQFTRLVPELLKRIHSNGPDAIRMLRLLLEDLFEVEQYITLDRIHKGEVAQVKRCALKREGKKSPETCVVKVIDLPREFLRCDASILNIYSEVAMMERVSREPGFCQIYDYGIRSDSAYIVMQDCRCSLRDWIEQFPVSSPSSIRLILRIFLCIAQSVQRLHQKVIVHFDLKCSNILLKGGSSNEGFWVPETENPEFDILLADFGVARCYEGQDHLGTVRNRGTEYSKAPEMLLITNMQRRSVRNYDRRRMKGVGFPSDVWALGCLLFELLTRQMLHFDRDWARFYTRVTQNMMPLFDNDKIKLLDESYRLEILELLQFMLVRDPQWRPSVAAVIEKVESLLETDTLPAYMPPPCANCLPRMFPIAPPRAFERIPSSEWLSQLLSPDTHFTLYLTQLRLTVTILDGNLYSTDLLTYLDRLNGVLLSGIVYIGDAAVTEKSEFSEAFHSRIQGFCSRRQTEALFLSSLYLQEDRLKQEIKGTLREWCRFKGPEWTLSLTTVRGCVLPFFDFLLDVVMALEECPCLKAISILKERVGV